jgi:hypothetical protein
MAFTGLVGGLGTDTSSPSRFLQGQDPSNTRALALDVFGGEVFTAFNLATVFMDKVQSRTIREGRSARFPKIWKAASGYHQAGDELMGQTISTGEVVITVDDILVAHTGIYDLDDMLSHFDVRGPFSRELGLALARAFDKNCARSIIMAARNAGAGGPFPGGSVIVDSLLTNSGGSVSGVEWINQIRAARILMWGKDVPEDMPLYMAVNATVFDAIKWAKDSNGNYLVINRFFNDPSNGGQVAGHVETIQIDNVTIYRSRNLPTTDETSDTTVYSKYQGNYSTTTGILWNPMAAAVLKLMDVNLEYFRDVRRQEDFLVAKMLVGHGTLRPECAVEFKTA